MASVALVALGVVLVVLSGIALSFQTGVNATLGKVSGKSFASVVSFTVGLAALIIFFVIETYGIGAKGPTVERIKGEKLPLFATLLKSKTCSQRELQAYKLLKVGSDGPPPSPDSQGLGEAISEGSLTSRG